MTSSSESYRSDVSNADAASLKVMRVTSAGLPGSENEGAVGVENEGTVGGEYERKHPANPCAMTMITAA